MKNQSIKCSFKNHKEINAINYCQECKIYMCNKCINQHDGLFDNHHQYNLDKDIKEIFTGFCKEDNHYDLKYFCRNHNVLCCTACLCKIKNEGNGQHVDCEVCCIKDIKDEMKNKLKKNIKFLEELSYNLKESINEFKIKIEKINEKKEQIKLKIQKIFTKFRNSLNEREDELLLKIDELYNKYFFNEDLIKDYEKLPNKANISLDKGKEIDKQWNDNNLISLINDCINIENNIKDINTFNLAIKNFESNINLNLIFSPEEKGINNFVETIKTFGDIKLKKRKNVDKSYVILEVKGWDTDQDLEALGKKIINTIKKDGLNWIFNYKLEEIAFGVKKLVIGLIVEDNICSVQEIVDELESWEFDIQSVEVVSFNRY